MDFSDIFSGNTWDTVSNIIGNPLTQFAGQALLAGNGVRNASNLQNQTQGTLNTLNNLYGPTSPYATQMRQQLERRDAAAGRRSQYGPREAELAAKLTQAQSNLLSSPQYQNLLKGANTSPYASLGGLLGYNSRGQGQSPVGSTISNAQRLNNLRKGYNTLQGLFSPAVTGTEADLGGAAASLGETFGGGSGALDVGGGVFGSPAEFSLSPFSATNTADPLGSLSSSIGEGAGYAGLGGAGDFGGAASYLGSLGAGGGAAGSGYAGLGGASGLYDLYGTNAALAYPGATSSLFGGGAAGAGAGEGLSTAAGAGASEGLGAAGAGLAGSLFALPAGIAAYGLLSGLFGKGDNGNPYTNANEHWANALFQNPDLIKQYGAGDVNQYMNATGINDYQQAQDSLASMGGNENFFGNFLNNAENDA